MSMRRAVVRVGVPGLAVVMVASALAMAVAVEVLVPTSAAEASTLSVYEAVVAADSPGSRWKFDETSGSTAHDDLSSKNGSVSAGVTLGASGPMGSGSKAFTLDGGNCTGIGLNSHVSSFQGNTLSVEAWVRTTDSDGLIEAPQV